MKSTRHSEDGLVLGTRIVDRLPASDQIRQRKEVDELLRRLERQPGVILADEVGMGKTFVALAVATCTALRHPVGPVIVMAPSTLIPKWRQDLDTFCELYMENRRPVAVDGTSRASLLAPHALRYAEAKDGVTLFRLLDDAPKERAHLVFVSHGAMSRQRMDKWVNLALIAEALRRHARGGNSTLIQVKGVIHRFLAELIGMIGSERFHDLGEDLWQRLLRSPPENWREIYNGGLRHDERKLVDDPIPKAIIRSLDKLDLRVLADALKLMPLRARGRTERVTERIAAVRAELRNVDRTLWREILAKSKWRSPLLIMDEAHHLKNADTQLAKQLQSAESAEALRTGDGAMANSFDRMLFLTATPFQLGHKELVQVLRRFGDIRWTDPALGERDDFMKSLDELHHALDESQRTSIELQRAWSRMRPEELPPSPEQLDEWWRRMQSSDAADLTAQQRSFREAYELASRRRRTANELLRPLVLRHNKGDHWPDSSIRRRQRLEGASIDSRETKPGVGIDVPAEQLLPFFLAARAAVNPYKDLLGDALCSSYEAFRRTREEKQHPADFEGASDAKSSAQTERQQELDELLNDKWYLQQFDAALKLKSEAIHPKVAATVQRAADLWEQGEKVVVFAFYRHTCRALRKHISAEIERRLLAMARERLAMPRDSHGADRIEARIEQIQDRYFDKADSLGKRALDAALDGILDRHGSVIDKLEDRVLVRATLTTVMRRFLRVQLTLVRCFPFEDEKRLEPQHIVAALLDHADSSGISWRQKFDAFIEFTCGRCLPEERKQYLHALESINTGAYRSGDDDAEPGGDTPSMTLANVALCSGDTKMDSRVRRMRTFNSPFFPDVLVCSEVMAEGVDLQRFCRHMIHHDLAWNPSTIEQRTGRIDRIGCKAMKRHPIMSYLPYIGGGADERQFRVMRDREQWFQVVMGQDAVANLITAESVDATFPLPTAVVESLAFDLSVSPR